MLFHPAVMALTLADGVSLALLLPAGWFAWRLLRRWDPASAGADQIRLERQTYLVATALGFVFLVQIVSLLLFVFTADHLAMQFVGAMCAVGTLNVNPFGFPALYFKLVLFFLAANWLFMNRVDNRAPGYPLIRAKYWLLMIIVPLAAISAGIQWRYFDGLHPEVITSCCGRLFSSDGTNVMAEIAALPPLPAMWGFYGLFSAVVVAGIWSTRRPGAVWLFSLLSAAALPVAMAAVMGFVSPYLYEHPHHHCPFCLLKPEYGYLGYALYVPLFAATALGTGLGVTGRLSRSTSAHDVLERERPSVVILATGLFLWCMLFVAWVSWRSSLTLLE